MNKNNSFNKFAYLALIIILFVVIGVVKIGMDGSASEKNTENTTSPNITEINSENTTASAVKDTAKSEDTTAKTYSFRTDKQAKEHFEKHGSEFPYSSLEAYVEGANKVINNKAALTKTEKEDGDFIYYVEKTNEFVVVSTDGYIRTYFKPSAGKAYYERQ